MTIAAQGLILTVVSVVAGLVVLGLAVWVGVGASGRARALGVVGFLCLLLQAVVVPLANVVVGVTRQSYLAVGIVSVAVGLTAHALLAAAIVTACRQQRPTTPYPTPYPGPYPMPHAGAPMPPPATPPPHRGAPAQQPQDPYRP